MSVPSLSFAICNRKIQASCIETLEINWIELNYEMKLNEMKLIEIEIKIQFVILVEIYCHLKTWITFQL